MMLHQHLLGQSTSLSGNSNPALQTAAALSDGALLNYSQQPREDLKTFFETREGIYRNMVLSEYNRPRGNQQNPYHVQQGAAAAANNPLNGSIMTHGGVPVRVSFLTLSRDDFKLDDEMTTSKNNGMGGIPGEPEDFWADKICFNVGRELYVYHYRGTRTAADLARPIDKRVYKGTAPTVHCFNQELAHPKYCSLAIGFSTGQLQIIDPLERSTPSPVSRLYNEDRTCDKTAVTCIRWLPGQPNIFLAAYASGNLYVFNEEVAVLGTPPVWSLHKQGEKFSIFTCKSKLPRNPVYRWQIGDGAIHQFEFSGPDAKMMATVGHDGFLRIFDYQAMELLSVMKSYFGGLLTLSWSPDAKLIATGGEDDLLTVYSVQDRRVVCRGQAHKSWISQVKFDEYCCTTEEDLENFGAAEDSERLPSQAPPPPPPPPPPQSASGEMINTTPVMRAQTKRATPLSAASTLSRCSFASFGTINGTSAGVGVCYRIGSVGHDAQLCLWDITEDMLKPANVQRHRNSTIIAPMAGLEIQTSPLAGRLDILTEASPGGASMTGVTAAASTSSELSPATTTTTNTLKPEKPAKKKRFHRKGFSLGKLNMGGGGSSSNNNSSTSNGTGSTNSTVSTNPNGSVAAAVTNGNGTGSEKKNNHLLTSQISCCDETRLLGSRVCPRIQDVPIIEPLMCKRIAHERLTVLEFRKDAVVTACQEGYICTWARPTKTPATAGGTTSGGLGKRDCVNSPGTVSPENGMTASWTGNGGVTMTHHKSESSYSANNIDGGRNNVQKSPNASSPAYWVNNTSNQAYGYPL